MIHLPPNLVPSALLYRETLSPTACQLLERADKCRQLGDMRVVERKLDKLRRSSQRGRMHIEHAIALICLSDVYREGGRLGPARRCAHKAYTILRGQVGSAQRHNQAVAAYNLGLIHHLLGDEREAADWYRTALRVLELACEHWARHNLGEQFADCRELERWVRALDVCLSREDEHDGFRSILVPVLVLGGEKDSLSVAELGVNCYRLNQRLVIGDRVFQVESVLVNGELSLRGRLVLKGEEYRILSIPDEACSEIQARRGDHVLVQRTERDQVDPDKPYVVEGAAGPEFGKFSRDSAGKVSFKSAVTGRIIGDVRCIYSPIALLRPEN